MGITEIIVSVLLMVLVLGSLFRDKVRKLLDGKSFSKTPEQEAEDEKEKVINGTSTKDKRSRKAKRWHPGGIIEFIPRPPTQRISPYGQKPNIKPVPTKKRGEE